MKRITFIALLIITAANAVAQTGSWRVHMSYYEPQQIVKAQDNLFVRASNSLYQYNMNDQSITTYNKVNALNDTKVATIAWNQQVKRLIIVYSNSNIDLMDIQGNVVNISSLYTKSMTQDKTVNSVFINDKFAYLATGFGVVKVNMQKSEISESYILGENINAIDIKDGTIYVRNSAGKVMCADMSTNLMDFHNWATADSKPSGLFATDLTDWNENIELVRTLKPGGPKYNNFNFMIRKNNTLYTVGGGYGSMELNLPATVQLMDSDGEWTFLQDDVKNNFPGTESSTWTFVDMMSVDVDPADSKHIYASGRTGLYEYYDGKLLNYFNKDNSIIETATSSNKYCIINGLTYDNEGNLWMLQSGTKTNSILELTKDGEWVKHDQSQLMYDGLSLKTLTKPIIDSRGLMWFVNEHYEMSSFYCYDTKNDVMVNAVVDLVNQDGISASSMYIPHFVTEDLEGNIWLCTQSGPYMIEASRVYEKIEYATQVKVPRNDGTNYADYLLAGVDVKCLAIDGGGRKWFGTNGSGVYLISADNMEQIANFTTENSPLLSDIVSSIVINNETGEVFFGTEDGLCSYMSDASQAMTDMVKDNVYAFPNPVVSGYDGLITVMGLSLDADVKIVSTSGQLVAQGRSNGGMFTWNGRDRSGRRVASGIYIVATATSDGKKGTVCKIAVIK